MTNLRDGVDQLSQRAHGQRDERDHRRDLGCYVDFLATNDETRYGIPEIICDNGTNGGGQG